MKFGTTVRKVVCRECKKHIGYTPDWIAESDYSGGIDPILCLEHGKPEQEEVKNDE